MHDFELDTLEPNKIENFEKSNIFVIKNDELDISIKDIDTICKNLDSKYEFHFYNENLSCLEKKLFSSLYNSGIQKKLARNFSNELYKLTKRFFTSLDKVNPIFFFSLRKISSEYLKNNNPSVSDSFHRDGSCWTLTNTFYGDGVEWIPNNNVKRDFFTKNSIQTTYDLSEICLDPSIKFNNVEKNKTIILKGELYPDIDKRTSEFISNFLDLNYIPNFNKGNSLIHRGAPCKDNSFRVVLTINIFEA